MGALTNKQALSGELEPYSVSQPTMIKDLLDAGFSSEEVDGDYKPEEKSKIAIAAIFVLKKLIVLTSDSLGKSSQGYSVDKLEDRIKGLCSENDLDADEYLDVPTVEDGSNLW